jgi:hypothetical protein
LQNLMVTFSTLAVTAPSPSSKRSCFMAKGMFCDAPDF